MSSKSGIIASIVIIIVVFGGIGGYLILTNPFEPETVAVVVMDPGFGDWGFADNVRLGMDEVGYEIAVEYYVPNDLPETVAEARTLINGLAESGDYILILVLGEELGPACSGAAEAYPDQMFGMIGAEIDALNVMSTSFATEQAAYIAGVLAAVEASYELSYIRLQNPYTLENFTMNYRTIGILAAVADDPAINRIVNGFIEGVQAANSTYNLNILLNPVQYVNSYGDNETASNMAFDMYWNQNVSILFAPVRASIHGVIEGANRSYTAPHWYSNYTESHPYFGLMGSPIVIAAEYNLDYYGTANPEIPVAPSYVITSVVAETNLAVYDIIYQTFWDEFDGKHHRHYTLSGGVNITSFEFSSTYVRAASLDAVAEFRYEIVTGTIIPTPP